ncbi:aspartyl-phosphate phosphatase Spo0E family protein [Metabacillus fastidiosus]|uniref:Aspartyl-phosphate phosphatase Spo0E family protein n=2 Tax=Metabacillus fastidiosus TaxID=1458 RepID=A0ABU6P1I7_9BACI|nr:aspartyl-phosphate phosphatase Spo0E family protein [Metabacillus fastidiosus]MED4403141.1 aspartyl-phosphate phosphatase Spo0E family protein [Metabacillus fastidiosus]MED4455375.1 aspartyl-phosphate phosphatase Spo0E family protein [Metabacillus fastidiosus]MED4461566.1 aspartyl-phosphate phosphatase Spo0E family protein [Metabacillus fastidiosus]
MEKTMILLTEIELKRKHLISTAKRFGLNAAETIQCSQELDTLILQQLKLTNHKTTKEKKTI